VGVWVDVDVDIDVEGSQQGTEEQTSERNSQPPAVGKCINPTTSNSQLSSRNFTDMKPQLGSYLTGLTITGHREQWFLTIFE